MFGILNFEAFIVAGVLLNLTPGADTMYILGRSIAYGKQAGIISALAISTGSLIHTVLAAMGLSVLLAESQLTFNIVKYIGAAYLIYLGIKMMIHTSHKIIQPITTGLFQSNRKIYFYGILTNVLNPKVALFYLAFLPQFIDPEYSNHLISFLVLGLTFTLTGTIWCLFLALFSSGVSERIRTNDHIKNWLHKITGLIFISLGLKLAFSEK
jgi:threonine/homoserine/homoserine lactone efflux protein